MKKRESKPTQVVKVGQVLVGGGFPVSVQTMGKQPLTNDLDDIRRQIRELHRRGCDILRFSVPDEESARCFSLLTRESPLPLVADIHFDHKLALLCIEGGAAKIRINPGNIGASWKVEEVVKAAADKGIPIRVGVNGGSLPGDLRNRPDKAEAMVEAAERELAILDKLNFQQVIFSLKASDPEETVKANEIFSLKYNFPLHLGVTEAGPLIPGIIKSTLAFQKLLSQNIGDTIRVSLSDSPEREVEAGKEILRSLGKKNGGVNLVSCPRCGRSTFDTHAFLARLENYLQGLEKDITVAVMGCVVNGPGEARGADIGITGAGDGVIIYRRGEIADKVPLSGALERFIEEIEKL